MNRVQTTVTESELQRALDCGELIRLYQPVIDLATGAPVQVETLLRWDHPGRGLLAPGEFLLDEDDSSLLVRIGWSVVIEAARPRRNLAPRVPGPADHGDGEPLRRSPRASGPAEPHRVPHGGQRGADTGWPRVRSRRAPPPLRTPPDARPADGAAQLRREVIVDDLGAAAAATDVEPDALRDWAVELFGTLRAFPLDLVKLDPRFVRRLESDDRLRAVIDAAHASDIAVVALAVEDEEMATRARARRLRPRAGLPLRPSRAPGRRSTSCSRRDEPAAASVGSLAAWPTRPSSPNSRCPSCPRCTQQRCA